MKHYTTDVKKRLTKVERSQIIIENPLNEIIIGLLFFFVKLNLFKFKDLSLVFRSKGSKNLLIS